MKRIQRIIPDYARPWLISMVTLNALVFYGTRPLTERMKHYDLSSAADDIIPFLPIFVIPYVVAFLQWIVGYVMITRESPELCRRICSAEMIAKILCGICFVLLPTTMVRPEIADTGIWYTLTDLIYRVDPPNNLFPSIHCLESWMVLRGTFSMKTASGRTRILMTVMTVLVFLSTVCIRQHVLVDMAGAVMAVEIGCFASSMLIDAGRKRTAYSH